MFPPPLKLGVLRLFSPQLANHGIVSVVHSLPKCWHSETSFYMIFWQFVVFGITSSCPFSFCYYDVYLFHINMPSLDKFHKYSEHKSFFCYMFSRYFPSSLYLLVLVYILLLFSCTFLTTDIYLLSSLWLSSILSHLGDFLHECFLMWLSSGLVYL